MERTRLGGEIIRDKWESNNLMIFEGDNSASGFSSSAVWPQRNYTCSFCKRQFNSAQALGGHMNVHRRDRAMLRQIPSLVFKQSLTNSNPSSMNFSSCSSSSTLANHPLPPPKYSVPSSHTRLSLVSPSFSSSPSSQWKKCTFSPPSEGLTIEKSIRRPNLEVVGEFKKISAKKFALEEVLKEDDDDDHHHREVISLDLEMGFKDPKEALDLELRLGCF